MKSQMGIEKFRFSVLCGTYLCSSAVYGGDDNDKESLGDNDTISIARKFATILGRYLYVKLRSGYALIDLRVRHSPKKS
jgi:hypothetical protein